MRKFGFPRLENEIWIFQMVYLSAKDSNSISSLENRYGKVFMLNGNNVFVTKRKQGFNKLSLFAAFHKSSINLKLKYEILKLLIF